MYDMYDMYDMYYMYDPHDLHDLYDLYELAHVMLPGGSRTVCTIDERRTRFSALGLLYGSCIVPFSCSSRFWDLLLIPIDDLLKGNTSIIK